MNKTYQKSTIETYNSTTQTVTTDLAPLQLVGTVATSSGCSMTASGTALQILNTGIYYIGADVTFTATDAGTEILQLYKDGNPLPCAIATGSAEAGTITTLHVETVIYIPTCCAIHPTITVNTSGVAGGVNNVSVTAMRLA